MSSEDKYWITLWLIVATGIVAMTLIICTFSFLVQKDLILGGFGRNTVVGYSSPIWTKP